MKIRWIISMLIMMVQAGAGPLWGQQNPLEKLEGTWKQDFSQTRPTPDPLPVSRIHRWEMLDNDKMRHFSERVYADGTKSVEENQIDDYSGKPYADGDEGETSIFRLIDSNTIQQIRTRNGQIARFLERVISPDEKTLTIQQVGVEANGNARQVIQVYHKQ
jgi:hypothetical protein